MKPSVLLGLVVALALMAANGLAKGNAYFECDTTKTIILYDSKGDPNFFYITKDLNNGCKFNFLPLAPQNLCVCACVCGVCA